MKNSKKQIKKLVIKKTNPEEELSIYVPYKPISVRKLKGRIIRRNEVKTLIKKNQEQLKKEKLKNKVLNYYKKSIRNLKKEYSNKFVVNVPIKIKVTIQDGEVQWLYENDILSSVDIFLLEHMNVKDKIINKVMKDMNKKYEILYKSFVKEMKTLDLDLDKIDDLFFEISE